MPAKFDELKQRVFEISDLRSALGLLEWDHLTTMPPNGAAVRAETSASVSKVAHELFVSDELGRLLDELGSYESELAEDSFDASLIRVVRRDWEKARRIPSELEAERARTASIAVEHWKDAREKSDFSLFRPWLDKNIELTRRYVDCLEGFGEFTEPYDALLDDFEPGMKATEVAEVFGVLKEELVKLTASIAERADSVDDECFKGTFPEEQQRAFALSVAERYGFDPAGWRIDTAVHPFAASMATTDVRITVRYKEDDLRECLFGALHETGHGLYEAGFDPELERTPLADGASLGFHESQSRLWENLVGRSRPFWNWLTPSLQQAFGGQLADFDAEAFYRGASKVEPSLIRVDADEVTYSLHIILRFELERELFNGELSVDELPEAWNTRMREYLGVEVPNDAMGVLQDIHWSGGGFGYFPTYALGNVISAQIWQKVTAALPDLDSQMERGEFGPLREWLGENVYRPGKKFLPADLLKRVTGSSLDAGPYVRYLNAKYGELYGLERAVDTVGVS